MKPTPPEKIKAKDRDLWYKRMSEKVPIYAEDEPLVGLLQWIELISSDKRDC